MTLSDIIRNPGKFEGEPEYVRYLWNDMIDTSDETIYDGDTPCEVFCLADEDRRAFDLDEGDHAIVLWESEQGFVNSRVMTAEQLARFRKECESADDTIE